jgi:hypothetical protein
MIKCLTWEDMMAHAEEAVGYHFKGDRFAALIHVCIAMGLASRLKDPGREDDSSLTKP